MSERFLLIGAHLRPEDAAVDGVTTFSFDDLTVSAAPYDPAAGAAAREVVARVAAMRRQLVDRETFIAIRYGASVSGAEEAAAKCREHASNWRNLLTTWRGTYEMTLKVLAASAAPLPDRRQFTSGADYLRALQAARSAKSLDAGFRSAVEDRLGGIAAAATWVPRPEAAYEYVFLIPRAMLPAVRERGLQLKESYPAVPFLISGPWPLEVFAGE